MADTVIDKFLTNHPDNPRFLLLRSISALKSRGIRKTKLKDIEEIIGTLNVILGFDSETFAADVNVVADAIHHQFYQRNRIKPNATLVGLLDTLELIPMVHKMHADEDNTLIKQILVC